MVGVSRGLLLNGLIVALAALGMVCVGISGGVGAAEMDPEPGVVYRLAGDKEHDRFGQELEPLDDLNGDRVPEFVVGAGEAIGTNVGYLRIYSGRDGRPLHTLRGWIEQQSFGTNITSMEDFSGDGKRELVVVDEAGLFIYDPVTAEELHRLDMEPNSISASAADAGDLDGDGKGDLFLGNQNSSVFGPISLAEGRVFSYSPSKSEVLWNRAGKIGGNIGAIVTRIDDSTGDGIPEILTIASPGPQATELWVLDGSSGETLSVISEPDLEQFGFAPQVLGDLNGDQIREFAMRADFPEDRWWKDGRGIVLIYDGATYEHFRRHEGVDRHYTDIGFDGDELGFRIGNAGDVDLDGVSDYWLGTSRIAGGNLRATIYLTGKAYLISGSTGKPLATYMGRIRNNAFLMGDLSRLGDVDGDGRPEFLLASPERNSLDRPGVRDPGEVRVLRFDPELPTFIRGDANGDGEVNVTDAYHVVLHAFEGEPVRCVRALDTDASGSVDLVDTFLLLTHLFGGRIAPAAPFPECSRVGGFLEYELLCEESTCVP